MKSFKNLVLIAVLIFTSVLIATAQTKETSTKIATQNGTPPIQTVDEQFTPDLFSKFVEMRVGRGEPVYWYCTGELYSYPEGKLIARVEGVDTARYLKSESTSTKAVQVSRKTFVYRDPETNEILHEINGRKVTPIEYPYQYITYELKDGKLLSTVEQGKLPNVQKIGPDGMSRVKRYGSTIVFSAPLFINIETARGKYQAYENYDFYYQLKGAGQFPYQLTWNRRGLLPPFFGGGDSVFQLVSYRVDKFEFLPKSMREYLDKDAPMWKEPPRDLKEIAELQKAN